MLALFIGNSCSLGGPAALLARFVCMMYHRQNYMQHMYQKLFNAGNQRLRLESGAGFSHERPNFG